MFSDNMRDVADRLTLKFGDTLTLHEPHPTGYNPVTGRNTGTGVTHSITAVVTSYDSSDLIDGVVLMDDKRILLYADDFDIYKNWTVTYDGADYSIVHVSKLSTQNKNVYYEIQARRL